MALTWQTHLLALACGEYLVHLGGGLLVTWGSKSRANSRKGLHEKLGLGFQLGPLLSKCVTRASDTPPWECSGRLCLAQWLLRQESLLSSTTHFTICVCWRIETQLVLCSSH